MSNMSGMDNVIARVDKALRVMGGVTRAAHPYPAARIAEAELDSVERCHAAGLMRVNHVGEVCAQALYEAQGRFTEEVELKQQFAQAAREEEDHLAWTVQRLGELGSRISLLNPLWFAGAYAMGALAAQLGNAQSLGFVVETERQVELHLQSHLTKLPEQDAKSRAIVEQMRIDEAEHGAMAKQLGAAEMPAAVRSAMQMMAKVMTTIAYYL